ncbi:uncharacterized protein LOC127289055 isoform X2 [Leptopilina boulardi]|uniref:uncharacterized protein LOC127289055 isoform X2 n=1 Tax=Leptopilina boulardi TaxID=63433 RepID=UPI0021F4FEA2|nr:uncharacterized protein LOC127289055 isoform X2 [Leptopilina boulardi]
MQHSMRDKQHPTCPPAFTFLQGALLENGSDSQGRTFGQKRLQLMLMAPMLYKMGVMMTMLMVLTVISLKGLVIGAILLILKLSSFLAKFYVGWHPQGHGQSWPQQHQQPFHVHVHGPQDHHEAYNAWPPHSETIGPEEHYYYKG